MFDIDFRSSLAHFYNDYIIIIPPSINIIFFL